MSVVHFVLVDFGGGSCCCSCCCDRGKTKSTPCPTWTELLSLDWSLTKVKILVQDRLWKKFYLSSSSEVITMN